MTLRFMQVNHHSSSIMSPVPLSTSFAKKTEILPREPGASFPLKPVGRTGQLVDPGGALERWVLGSYKRQRPRRQQAQSLRDIEHTQDVEEDRPVPVRHRWIDDHNLLDRRLEQGSVGRKDAGRTPADHLPGLLPLRLLIQRADPRSDIPDPSLVHRLAEEGVGSLHVVRGRFPRPRKGTVSTNN